MTHNESFQPAGFAVARVPTVCALLEHDHQTVCRRVIETATGNQRSAWDAGCRFDHPNPDYR